MPLPSYSPEATPNLRQYAEQALTRSKEVLGRAVSIVSPENPDASPLEVFPAPGEVRAEDPGLQLTESQQEELLAAAAELGFGRREDATLNERGLTGAYAIIEGGQPHKMLAEALMILQEGGATPRSIIFTASPRREVKSPAEVASAEKQTGRPGWEGMTEYDVARGLLPKLPGYKPRDKDIVLPYSYDINNDYEVSNKTTGQFIIPGSIGLASVLLMRIDREDYVDEESGKAKYRNQPDTADIVGIMDGILKASDPDTPIAFVTSGTCEPSRAVDAARASLAANRFVGIASYGTELLAKVKGEDVPAPGPITQLPGELRAMAVQAAKLEESLANKAEAELAEDRLERDLQERSARITRHEQAEPDRELNDEKDRP